MSEKTIIELMRETEVGRHIGTGQRASVYIFDKEPRLSSYLLRVTHDEGPSLEFLNSTSCLTPVSNSFNGQNFGQAILDVEGVSITVKKGHSLGGIKNHWAGKNNLNPVYYDKFGSSGNISALINSLHPDSFERLASELDSLSKLGKGIDHLGDNMVVTLDDRLGFIDIDGYKRNNRKTNVIAMLPRNLGKAQAIFNSVFTDAREQQRIKEEDKVGNTNVLVYNNDIPSISLGSPVSKLIELINFIEIKYKLEIFRS